MKRFLRVLSLFVVAIIGMFLVGCGKSNGIESEILGKTGDIYGFGAITSANILSDMGTSQRQSVRTNSRFVNPEIPEIDMDKVNEYVQMMENMLIDDGPILISEEASDREGFESKLTFNATDLAGRNIEYVLYINKVLIKEDDYDDDFEDQFEDMFDFEKEYNINGIAIVDGFEYTIRGENETDDDETELTLTISLDRDNYVVINQEKELGEEEYSYVVYKEGKVYTRLTMEKEDNREVEVSFSTTNESGSKQSFKFEKEVEFGVQLLKIHYESDGQLFNIRAKGIVDNNTGDVIYEYEVIELDKSYKYFKD